MAVENLYEGLAYWYPRLRIWKGEHFEPPGLLRLDEVWKCPISAPSGARVNLTCEVYLSNRTYKGVTHSDWVTVRDSTSYIYNYLEARFYKSETPLPEPPPPPSIDPPIIKLIEPCPVDLGGDITITGENFAVSPARNWLWFEHEKMRFHLLPTTRDSTKIRMSLAGSDPLTMPQYAGDWLVSVERLYDHQVSNKVTLVLSLPEPECTDGDEKCEDGALYYCKYGRWWLWERNSPRCVDGPEPEPRPPPEPPPEPEPEPEVPHIDSVYPVPCELDGKLNIIGHSFSSEPDRNWVHLVRSGYTPVLTMPDAASPTNLQVNISKIAYALAPGNWSLYVETVIDSVHRDSNLVTVTFGEEPPSPPPPPGAKFSLTTSVTPEGGGWVGRSPSQAAYEPGTRVKLNALPAADYKFTNWGGDATGTDDTTYITMDSDKYVIANFESTLLPDVPIVKQIIEWLRDALVSLRQWFDRLLTGAIGRIGAALKAVFSTLISPISTALSWVKGKLQEVAGWVQSTYSSVLELVVSIGGIVASAVSSSIMRVFEWITSAASTIISDVKLRLEALKATLGTFLDKVKTDIWARLIEVRDFLDGKLWHQESLMHHLIYQEEGHFFTSYGEMQASKEEIIGEVTARTRGLENWFIDNVVDPITDWFKEWWADLKSKGGGVWNTIITWLRTFFTETIPDLAMKLWAKMKSAAAWVTDTVGGLLSDAFEYVMGLIKAIAPISPEGGVGAFSGLTKIGIALAGGLGIMTVAGNLVHPLHSLGFEHVSAMVYDLTNYKLLTGAMMGALAASAIRTPISYYFNSLLRPWLLDRRSFMDLMSRRAFTDPEALRNPDLTTTVSKVAGGSGRGFEDRMIGYFGNPAEYYGFFKELANTPLRYFPLAGIARTGFFETEWFTEALHRSGYSETAVQALMVMYRKMADESVRGMMSGAAVTRFKEGFTTESQFGSEMALLGYSDIQFQPYLAAARMDYATDYLRDLLDAYRDAVRKGNLSLDEYRGSLLTLGMVPERVEGYVLRERARLKPTEPLTPIAPAKPEYETDAGRVKVDTIRRRRRKEIISRDQEVSALQFLGMDPGYAGAIADNDDIRLTKAEE